MTAPRVLPAQALEFLRRNGYVQLASKPGLWTARRNGTSYYIDYRRDPAGTAYSYRGNDKPGMGDEGILRSIRAMQDAAQTTLNTLDTSKPTGGPPA